VAKPAGRRPGRPQHKPTEKARAEVEGLASIGIPQHTIASIRKISIMTLRKHYADELEHGTDKANSRVGGFLFQKATGQRGDDHGAVTAAIFWLKARAGWKDRQDVIHQNPDGTALFEDWPGDKLAAVSRRAADVLEREAKQKKATG
jgi:hypothetical protein